MICAIQTRCAIIKYHFMFSCLFGCTFICQNFKGLIEAKPFCDVQVYSLIGGFCSSPVNFHAKDGSGYKFLGEIVVQLDKINPQVCFYYTHEIGI